MQTEMGGARRKREEGRKGWEDENDARGEEWAKKEKNDEGGRREEGVGGTRLPLATSIGDWAHRPWKGQKGEDV